MKPDNILLNFDKDAIKVADVKLADCGKLLRFSVELNRANACHRGCMGRRI